MSEYMFGITTTKPTAAEAKRRDKVARKHGGAYTEVNRRAGSALGINHGQYQGWFAIPNRGNPFDQRTAAAINDELAAQ
jgi:hypothetical protein